MATRPGKKAGKKAARRIASRVARRTGTAAAKPAGLAALVRSEVARALAEERSSRSSRGANRATIIVFSGDLDRVMSALILATGAAAVGMEVSLFFTFWGLGALRRGTIVAGDGALSRAFTALTPAGLSRLGLSRLNFGGLGARMLRTMMKQKGVATAEELLALARESNVRIVACTTSMDLMGLSPKDLVPGVEVGGVATYLGDAADSRITLFI